MWLHPLQSVYEKAPALEVDCTLFRDNATLDIASGPESMPHRTPWIFRICAKIALAVLANMEPRCGLGDCEINDARFIGDGLDRVRLTVLTERNGCTISVEREFFLIEVDIVQRV